ncbi:MAG: hypothetical protein ACREMA_10390 [Longimicrobiales bacterium]
MKHKAWRAVLALVLGASSAGCYTYAPVPAARPGMDVRARLTAEAAVKRSQGLDEPIMLVDGTVVEATPTTVAVNVLVARTSSAFQNVEIRDTVRLETLEIQSLMARKFSPGKTALATVVAALAAYGAFTTFEQIVGGTDDPSDPGNPNIRGSRSIPPGFRLLRFGAAR